MTRPLLARIHNPKGLECGCAPGCWCRRTWWGRALRWYVPWRHDFSSSGVKHQSGRVTVVGVEPIFSVGDVPRAVAHYERLGFKISHHDASYAFAHRDRLTIHLAQAEDLQSRRPGSLYLHVDDADRMAADWRNAGLEVVGPENYDYGKREGSHADPDGNLIRFGSPLPPGARTRRS